MKNARQDRRSQRTRHLLNAALVELMLEKQYDAITIQDILDRANVGRSTFYGHYTGKDDLLFSNMGQMLHALDQHPSREVNSALLPSLELFRHVHEYERLYKALIWSHAEVIQKSFQAQLSALVEHNLPDGAELTVPRPAVANFVAGSFLTLLRWWLDSNTNYSAEEIDEMFQQLVQPGVQAILRLPHQGQNR